MLEARGPERARFQRRHGGQTGPTPAGRIASAPKCAARRNQQLRFPNRAILRRIVNAIESQ